MMALRRSARTAAAAYESNGRQYLANVVGWSREQLDEWLISSTVQPHLFLWYKLCYVGSRRFNDGIDWINTGQKGYFYNSSDLEEDLLLCCLGEGDPTGGEEQNVGVYGDLKACTYTWSTQEVWARTAWQIVHSNRSPGQAFHKAVIEHPAAAYGFVIDILCISFHSLAFRRSKSVWEDILNRYTSGVEGPVELDLEPGTADEGGRSETASTPDSELSTILDDDGDFEDPDMPFTPLMRSLVPVSPKAPRRTKSIRDAHAQNTFEWMDSVGQDPMALDLRDEDGAAITGYRRAPKVLNEIEVVHRKRH